MRKLLISFLSVLPFVMLSCDDDDEDPMPPLRMEFVETITDSKSIVSQRRTLCGQTLLV